MGRWHRVIPALAVSLTALLARAPSGAGVPSGTPDAEVAAIIERYNATLDLATRSLDSLRVIQEMTEPQGDGASRTATAELRYVRDAGMERRVLSSNLSYPAGEYTLASLLGPRLDPAEYEIGLARDENVDGVLCHRLEVKATLRDASHIDGTVWVSAATGGPVRILGEVADPPFPIAEIRLDKKFEPGPLGFALLRRHDGEVRAGLVLGRRRGTRAVTYSGYVLNGKMED